MPRGSRQPKLDEQEIAIYRERIGDPLGAARKRAGMTIEQLADHADVAPNTIKETVAGRNPIQWPTLQKIVTALGEPENDWEQRLIQAKADRTAYQAAKNGGRTGGSPWWRRKPQPVPLLIAAIVGLGLVVAVRIVVSPDQPAQAAGGAGSGIGLPPLADPGLPTIEGTIMYTNNGVQKYPSADNNRGSQPGPQPGAAVYVVCQKPNGRRVTDDMPPMKTPNTSTVWDRVIIDGRLWFVHDLFVQLSPRQLPPTCPTS